MTLPEPLKGALAAKSVQDGPEMVRASQDSARDLLDPLFLRFVAGNRYLGFIQDAAQPDHMNYLVRQNIDKEWVQIFRQFLSLRRLQNAPIVELDAIKVKSPALIYPLQATHAGQHRIRNRFPSVICLSKQIKAKPLPSERGNAVIARCAALRLIQGTEYHVSLRG